MQMIQTLIRNFVKRPATRKYPLVKRDPFENYRGRLVNHVQSCIFCRMCSTKCPAQCISTDPKEAYWGYDPFSCVYCGICVEVCPTKSLFMLSTHRSPVPDKFVVYHKGQARVARPRLASMPNAAPGEIHAETPPPSVIAATKITAEPADTPASPVPAARPAPVPPAKRKTEEAAPAVAPQTARIAPENTLGLSSEAIVHVPVSAPLEGVEVASLAGEAAPDRGTAQDAARNVTPDTAENVAQDAGAPEPAAPAVDAAPAEPAGAASEPAEPTRAEPAAPATTSKAPSEAKAEPSSGQTAASKTATRTESTKRGRKSGGKSGKKGA